MPQTRGIYARYECADEQFEKDKLVQKQNGTSFREHRLGARKKLIVHNRMVSTTASKNSLDLKGLSKRRFVAFLGRFQKQLYKRFRTIEGLYDIDIKYSGISRGKNQAIWDSMKVGTVFYNVDCKSAYWQIGHNLGYIDDKLFHDYMHDDLFKSAKRYCFSFLARRNVMTYHTPKGTVEMICDMSVLKKAYENVRRQLYVEIAQAKKKCKSVVDWNIDGVSVLKKDLNIIRESFKISGIEFKVTLCRKTSEYEYLHGSKVKFFTRRKE